ncbi:MAG: thiamine-phosphate kinase [Chloroflexota bacterium]
MNKASDLGEFGLIERLSRIVGVPNRDDLIVGIGDDAAVWRLGEEYVIATTDTMVEGVHFERGAMRWHDIGWKAMAVNISDIAAMGGWPRIALVTLALPPDADIHHLDELYEGLRNSAMISATYIVGGDTVRAEQLSVGVTVLGRGEVNEAGELLLLRRDAARAGDVIAVTGPLGDSAGGLRRLREGATDRDELVSKHVMPRARLAEGTVAVQLGVRCAIDVSDGLLQDIGHICKASKVGAVLRASDIPISDALRAAYANDALELACTGGEDYELVLVGEEPLIAQTAIELEAEITVIGEIVAHPIGEVRLLDRDGTALKFERPGWDAFR